MNLNHRIDEHLSITLIVASMSEELFQVVEENRNYLREWLPWLDGNTSIADSLQFIEGTVSAFERKEQINWAIMLKKNLIGVLGFHSLDWNVRTGKIGYWLSASECGKGVMTRCVQAIEEIGFKELGLEKTEIHCAVGNKRSRSIPERLHYTQEGIIRRGENLYGQIVDLVIYGKLKDE